MKESSQYDLISEEKKKYDGVDSLLKVWNRMKEYPTVKIDEIERNTLSEPVRRIPVKGWIAKQWIWLAHGVNGSFYENKYSKRRKNLTWSQIRLKSITMNLIISTTSINNMIMLWIEVIVYELLVVLIE